jgi:hypothetical protein
VNHVQRSRLFAVGFSHERDLKPDHELLYVAAVDIAGARSDELPLAFRREVIDRYPRRELAAEFTACVKDQAARKSDTSARRLVDGGVERKLRENPLERLT